MKRIIIILSTLILLGISSSSRAAEPFWEYLNGPEGGLVSNVTYFKNTNELFLADKHGLFKSKDEGLTWERYFFRNNLNFAPTVTEDGTVYGYELGKFFFTSDSGKKINYFTNLPKASQPVAVLADKDKIISVRGNDRVIDTLMVSSSSDKGKSWNSSIFLKNDYFKISSLENIFVEADYRFDIIAISLTYNKSDSTFILISNDFNKTWDIIKCNFYLDLYKVINDSTFIVSTFNQFLISKDRGKTWNNFWNFSFLNYSDDAEFIGVNQDSIYISNDTGKIWNSIARSNNIERFIIKLTNGKYIGWGYNGGFYYSNDTCKTWIRSNKGFVASNMRDIAFDRDGNVYVVGIGVYKSSNRGKTWELIGYPNNRFKTLTLNKQGHLFTAGLTSGIDSGGVYRTTDNGRTWNRYSEGLKIGTGDPPPIYDLLVNKRGYIFAGHNLSGFFESKDNGETWTFEQPGGGSNCFDFNSEGHIFRGDWDGIIYRSIDDGDTWEKQGIGNYETGCDNEILGFTFDIKDSLGWTTCMKTTDNGRTWKNYKYEEFNFDEFPGAIDSLGNYLKIRRNDGLEHYEFYKSIDKGKAWETLVNGLEHYTFNFLAVSPDGYYYLSAQDGGLYRSREKFVSVREEFQLKNQEIISPNPASDFIEINVGDNLIGEIGIYDVFGQKATTPALRATPPYEGGEKVRIDVSGLASGMYFVRIGAEVKKIIKL